MLTQLSLKNFKNLKETTVDFKALNIFVGPNGSGKSNLVSALKFYNAWQRPGEMFETSPFQRAASESGNLSPLNKQLPKPGVVQLNNKIILETTFFAKVSIQALSGANAIVLKNH